MQIKPLLLVLENSTMCGSVALVTGNQCLAEYSLESRLTHSKRLLGVVDILMNDCRVGWDDLDAIAVSLGPGSFTGLRICLATAKGLALAAGLPLLGIPSLDGLAAQLPFSSHPVCALLDARKKEVYAAFYRNNIGKSERISDYMAVSPEKLVEMIKEPVILVGDGVELYRDLFKERLGKNALFVPLQIFQTRAAAIGLSAIGKWLNKDFLDTSAAVPIYVRPSDAEIHFKN